MCLFLVKEINSYFSKNPTLNAIAHSAGGFGLAVVLQHYLQGGEFVSVWVGWALIGLSAAMHLYPVVMKK